MVKTETSSDNNKRETFWKFAFWCVTSSHWIPPFPSLNSLLTLLTCVLKGDIWELTVGYGENGNILRSKPERILLSNCISMCECISEWHVSLQCSVCYHSFLEICNGILLNAMKLTVKKEKSSDENKKEALLQSSCWCVNSSHRITLMFYAGVH